MNATEKLRLPVDGILEVFGSLAGGLHRSRPAPAGAAPAPAPHQHPRVSDLSKTGMGIIKAVKGRWRSSISADRLPESSAGLTEPRHCHRVVVLGAPKVGKTSILRRFLGNDFQERYEPTSEDFHRKLFHIRGEAYQVDILDAASERNFPAKRRLSILTGDTFLLVFSLDDRQSLDEACALLREIRAAKATLMKLKRPATVPVVVCGNKADLGPRRAVARPDAAEALGEDVAFFETSARDGAGLGAAFGALASLGGLPDETGPSRHRVVPILTYRSLRAGAGSRTRGPGAPCAALDPLARRPSFTSDLRLVLESSAKRSKPERCQIQ